jgi:hypothetical protein
MSQHKHGLTRAEYLEYRGRYIPEHRKIVFVLESPPISGLYFYKPEGSVSEPLFRAMMKDVLDIKPRTKEEGLREFAARGFLLIDATYTPVNHLSGRARDAAILDELPLLVEDLIEYVEPGTNVILVKANVCDLLEEKLSRFGFAVLNRGTRIPFPSTGQQNKFRDAVRRVLGL